MTERNFLDEFDFSPQECVSSLSWSSLVDGCLREEANMWREFVRRVQGLVWSIAQRSSPSGSDVEDVFQNTMVIAWENLGTLRDPDKVASWISSIARNEAHRVARLAARAGTTTGVDDSEWSSDEEDVLEATEWRATLRELIGNGMKTLSYSERRLLEAQFFDREEMSYDRLATVLGSPRGSLGPTRRRALDRLRNWLCTVRPDFFVSEPGCEDSTFAGRVSPGECAPTVRRNITRRSSLREELEE